MKVYKFVIIYSNLLTISFISHIIKEIHRIASKDCAAEF